MGGNRRSSITTGRPYRDRGAPAAGPQGAGEPLAGALLNHLAPEEGQPVADPAVAAGLAVAEAVRKGLSQPAAALEFQTQVVGSIAQKKTRKSARPSVRELTPGFRVQPNPADSSLLGPCVSLRRRTVWQGWTFLKRPAESSLVAPLQRDLRCKHCQMFVRLCELHTFPDLRSRRLLLKTSIRSVS